MEPLLCQRHLFGLPSPGTTAASPLYLNGASRSPLLSSVAAVGRVSKAASTPFKIIGPTSPKRSLGTNDSPFSQASVDLKVQPWQIGDSMEVVEDIRALFATLVGATPGDIALTPSTAYAVSMAAMNVRFREGQTTCVVLENQMASNVYPWQHKVAEVECSRKRRAGDNDDTTTTTTTTTGDVRIVTRAQSEKYGGWTAAIIASIDAAVGCVAVPHCHW